YLLVMVAALTEPLGLVAGVREVSALFGVTLGAGVLKERVTSRHALAVFVAVIGIVAIASS
ncbi:MAG: EamA family transporter, partial [Acidimicrobiia bacterium]